MKPLTILFISVFLNLIYLLDIFLYNNHGSVEEITSGELTLKNAVGECEPRPPSSPSLVVNSLCPKAIHSVLRQASLIGNLPYAHSKVTSHTP